MSYTEDQVQRHWRRFFLNEPAAAAPSAAAPAGAATAPAAPDSPVVYPRRAPGCPRHLHPAFQLKYAESDDDETEDEREVVAVPVYELDSDDEFVLVL